MENIIILILFTYPGIMSDYFHGLMVKGKQYEKKTEEPIRAARDFFISAVITVAGMGVFSLITRTAFSLSGIRDALQSGRNLAIYLPISLTLALMAALIWYAGNRILFWSRNKLRSNQGKSTIGEGKSVWKSIFDDPDIDYNNSAFAIYQDGKLIRAGLPFDVSDDIQNDPWAILTWTETARMDLEQPAEERTLLITPKYSCVNIGNGVTVDIYDGGLMRKFISSEDEEQKQRESWKSTMPRPIINTPRGFPPPPAPPKNWKSTMPIPINVPRGVPAPPAPPKKTKD